MPDSHGTLYINSFYPETELNITEIQEYEKQILIRMKSISKDCRCPKCGCTTDKYHGTYIRKVQDLPILGKRVQLEICSHEYECINDGCEATTFTETFDGFLNTYSRMTERCADFICTLAIESSCEGCARICKALGIKISGDTVIRLLLRKYEVLPGPEVGDVIGVDDFAYLFIEKYCKSTIKAVKSFAEGLKRDIVAVENAVAYDYSNGFVEGTNSRLKMIKRTMYGRCRKQLLEAKLRYVGKFKNG